MSIKDENHIPGMRGPLLGLRIAQLVLAILILGLSAYGVYWLVYSGDTLTLSAAVVSIVIGIYVIVATALAPAMYNYWAIIGLDILAVILWAVSFPILAAQIATAVVYNSAYEYSTYYPYYYYKDKRRLGMEKRAETTWETYKSIMIATSSLGALEFILFLVTLIILGVQVHRHRKVGGHCVPDSAASREKDGERVSQRNAIAIEEPN